MASKAELSLILSLVDEVSDVAKSVKGDLLDVGEAGQGVQGIMGSTAKSLMSLGSTAVLGAIGLTVAAVAAIGGAAFAAGMKVDEAYDKIAIGTGATGRELEGLQRSFDTVFTSVPTDAGTASDVIATLNSRLGITGGTLEGLAAPLLRVSDMMGGDAKQNTELFTRVMGDWGVSNEDAAGTLDAFFAASQLTGSGMDSLMQKVVQFGSPLRLMGFDLNEATALFAQFEAQGVNSELVMGSLRIAAGKFAKEGVNLQAGLNDTIASIKGAKDESAALALGMEVFGARAGPDMVAAIREGRFSVDELTAAVAGSEGAIMAASEATMDWPEKLELLKNKATVALEPLGMAFMNIAGMLLDKLMPLFDRLAAWFAETLAPAIEAAMPGIEDLINAFALLFQGDTASFTELLVNGLYTIGEAFGLTKEQMQPFLTGLWDVIDTVVAFVTDHGPAIKSALLAIGAVLAGAAIASGIMSIVGAIAALANPVTLVIAAIALLAVAWTEDWGGIRTTLTEAWAAIQPTLQIVMDWLSIKVPAAINWMRDAIGAALAFVKGLFASNKDDVTSTVSGLWATVTSAFTVALDFVKGVVGGALDAIRAWWDEHGANVLLIVNTLWTLVQTAFEAAKTVITTIITTLVSVVTTLWNEFKDELLAIVTAMWVLVQAAFETAKEVLGGIVDAIAAALKGDWTTFGEELRGITDAIWGFLKTSFETGWATLVTVVTGIVDALKKLFTDIDWGAVGTGIIDGIKSGVTNAASALGDAAKAAAEGALKAVKGFLGINSPSTVFAAIGGNLMEGFALGIQRNAALPASASASAAQLVSQSTTRNSTVVHNYNLTAQYGGYQSERSLRSDVRLLSMLARG
jgi:phage-related minor tail protein